MSFRSIAITAITTALLLSSEGNARAEFVSVDAFSPRALNLISAEPWTAIADGGCSASEDDWDGDGDSDAADDFAEWFDFESAWFGQIASLLPGGMSSSPNSDAGNGTGIMPAFMSPIEFGSLSSAGWLWIDGQPRLPPPMSTMILDPPRGSVTA